MEFKVNIERTQNKFINKFEVSNFITNHISNEYNNIDEAKDSKLAQVRRATSRTTIFNFAIFSIHNEVYVKRRSNP